MIIVNARFLTQNITGVQRFAIEISKELRKLSNQFVFVSPANINDKKLADELNVTVIGKNTGTIWEQLDLRVYLATKNKPLLVNFCNTGLLFYTKQIVTVHDMSYKVEPKWFSNFFYVWYNFLIPNIVKNSLKIFTVSNSSKNDIVKYLNIKPEKISIIYNSSNLITNHNFENNNKKKYLLTVSTLEPRKNLTSLVEAFKLVKQELKLVIVGLRNNNFTLDNSLLNENIEIKGYVNDEDLMLLMHEAEAFIYVSYYEGFGLPPIEAMSAGCPVIVSDIPAHKEVCGNAALYVDPYNIIDIKNKINELLSNPVLKQQLIIAGKENITRFSWFKSAEQVLMNINEII